MGAGRDRRGAGPTVPGAGGPAGAAEPGDQVDAAEEVDVAEEVAAARAIVLRQLTVMARSREQLRVKLRSAGVAADIAEGVLDRFEAVGLVDDAAYAESLVRTRREQRGLSRRGLARELRAKGVDDETAAGALEGVSDEDEVATALALARRKAESTRGLGRDVRQRRIAGMLGRKGYPSDVVMKVTRLVLAGDA